VNSEKKFEGMLMLLLSSWTAWWLVCTKLTRQAVYVERNIEECLCNHCYSGTAISITYSECMFVALGIHHVMCICHIVICGLTLPMMFFRIISLMGRFLKKSCWT